VRIVLVHNTYQHPGGEDSVVNAEIELLRSRGHEVATYFRNNDDIGAMSLTSAARQTLWSSRTTTELAELVRNFSPAVIHAHNTFPLISPSLYWAAEQASVPVVQTLHNFRLMCLNGVFLREGRVCEDCQGRVPWRGVLRKCYRGSGAASAVLAGMLTLHRGMGTYRNKVARYIALNDFCRNKFIEGGLPAARIVVKPNFVDLPTPEVLARRGLLFVGRLSVEKGVATLARAAALLPDAGLRVAGDGPDSALLDGVPGLVRLGSLPGEVVLREMHVAVALVVPSIWYENFPRTIVEAFATGLPVIASRIGALAELVCEGETGLLFEPGNPDDLAKKMAWALANPERMAEMGRKARAQYEAEFSADVNYRQLVTIYQDVLGEARMSAITK
jgi:glycosyltransferase involved in cell wall biosynthesis